MARTTTVEISLELVPLTCCWEDCGVSFAVPLRLEQSLRRSHRAFYCPHGHQQSFAVKSEEERLRERVASLQGNLTFEQERAERLTRSLSATRGVRTRVLNRIRNGQCPFCGRRFDALGLHLEAEHSDQLAAQTAGDESAEVIAE
jgi:hypothetical protein